MTVWCAAHCSIFTTLSDDMGAVQQATADPAVSAGDYSGVRSACQKGEDDVQTALGLPAIPMADVASHWRAGLTFFHQAYEDCIQGVDTTDATLITRASTEMADGTTEVDQANSAITGG